MATMSVRVLPSSGSTRASVSKVMGRWCSRFRRVARPSRNFCQRALRCGTWKTGASVRSSPISTSPGWCDSSRAVATTRWVASGVRCRSAFFCSKERVSWSSCRFSSMPPARVLLMMAATRSSTTVPRVRPGRKWRWMSASMTWLTAQIGGDLADLAGDAGQEVEVGGVGGGAGGVRHEVVHLGCAGLAVAVDAADALLQPGRVERDVEVDQPVAVGLQVDALPGGVGGHQDAHWVVGGVGGEALADQFAFLRVGVSLDHRQSVAVAL